METENVIEIVQKDEVVIEKAQGINTVMGRAKALVITDDATYQEGAELSIIIRTKLKELDERRKFFVDPLNDTVKKYNAYFHTLSDPVTAVKEDLDRRTSRYHADQVEAARRKQAELQAEADKKEALARQEYERSVAQAQAEDLPVPAPPMPEVAPPVAEAQAPAKTVKTESGGSLTMKEDWDFEVVNPALVPDKYKIVDVKGVRLYVKAGERDIPGIRIFPRYTPSGRA